MTPASRDVAVIGMAGRFPGAPDLDAFWANLRDGVESVTALSEDDLLAEGIGRELFERDDYVRVASLLDGHDLFDARFFGFSAREATLLDPQQRLFLECSWHALEDAALDPASVRRGGIFAGANMPAYWMSNLLGGRRIVLDADVFEQQIHNDKDYLATRTAHRLGFTGPAVSVQTACSTSLVAVHEGIKSLLVDECDVVLAGGVCVRVPQRAGYLAERGMVHSPDGHCRPFDARGAGTVFGNGVGVVVLKRLADALADGDRVLAVVKGSAVNNDGTDKVGFTAPGVAGQERVVREALRAAGVPARSVTAVEAHGTATPIGDPIEIKALTRAFRDTTDASGFCSVGSVKGNIGHLESAAGIAGFIKAVLQLRHRQLAPTAHFTAPNPRIDFAATPFRVDAALRTWEAEEFPRRIGVSAFGIGGTNAHVILEEAARPTAAAVEGTAADGPQLLVLSAKSPEALDTATRRLTARLAEPGAPDLADAAYTLQTGRSPMRHRRTLLRAGSAPYAEHTGESGAGRLRTVFLFPGQGAQYPGMGRELHAAEPVFAEHLDHCAEVLRDELGFDVRELLLDRNAPAERLTATEVAQPALFTVEYALARLLASWGIAPDGMVGHSLGEYVAACLAGVFTVEDALRLVALRGRLMAARPAGAMLSVQAPEERVRELLVDGLDIAAVNAPELCVASGPEQLVADLAERLAATGVPARPLHTSHAFHSPMMEPAVAPFTEAVRTARPAAPQRPFASGVTGAAITAEQATDPAYWGGHIRRPVRFADALRTALPTGRCALVEVGPGTTLSSLARAALGTRKGLTVVRTMPRPTEAESERVTLLSGVGDLWLAGAEVDWRALHRVPRQRVALPGYPFARERYWIEPRGGGQQAAGASEERHSEPAQVQARTARPGGLRTAYAAPDSDTEKQVVALWEEFLEYEPVGVHDDFFELGGHSLLATRIANRLTEVLRKQVSVRDVLAHATPARLAAALDGRDG
ncbi:type I polyketide synthase [Streptomyces rimosus]|uniref:type I polyketide synthase n=1 Tax=Streptomyces rimosus TaxID=1927 RepID=UPI00067CCFD5|nr:type I polyketide synthase [Streptomyces rimosus]